MSTVNMENAQAELPSELVAALKVAGFAKVASALAGVECTSEAEIYEKIGTAFFVRRKEAELIQKGLLSIKALESAE